MPIKPNDATTILNPGVGGDTMDESSVTQNNTDGSTTTAKRARVVMGFDDGTLLGHQGDNGLGVPAQTWDEDANNKLDDILLHMKVQTGLLKLIASALNADDLDDAELAELGDVDS